MCIWKLSCVSLRATDSFRTLSGLGSTYPELLEFCSGNFNPYQDTSTTLPWAKIVTRMCLGAPSVSLLEAVWLVSGNKWSLVWHCDKPLELPEMVSALVGRPKLSTHSSVFRFLSISSGWIRPTGSICLVSHGCVLTQTSYFQKKWPR